MLNRLLCDEDLGNLSVLVARVTGRAPRAHTTIYAPAGVYEHRAERRVRRPWDGDNDELARLALASNYARPGILFEPDDDRAALLNLGVPLGEAAREFQPVIRVNLHGISCGGLSWRFRELLKMDLAVIGEQLGVAITHCKSGRRKYLVLECQVQEEGRWIHYQPKRRKQITRCAYLVLGKRGAHWVMEVADWYRRLTGRALTNFERNKRRPPFPADPPGTLSPDPLPKEIPTALWPCSELGGSDRSAADSVLAAEDRRPARTSRVAADRQRAVGGSQRIRAKLTSDHRERSRQHEFVRSREKNFDGVQKSM